MRRDWKELGEYWEVKLFQWFGWDEGQGRAVVAGLAEAQQSVQP